MFDTMTVTKTIGALAGTLLIYLLGNLVAGSIYGNESEGGGGEAENAYVIETPDAPAAPDQVVEVASVDFATLLAAASVGAGQKTFGKCKACHKIEPGVNGVGPSLFGVVGRDIASAEGYGYSATLSELPGNWTVEALNDFLESPKTYAPGTKMTFRGLSAIEDRANLIGYLSTIGG